MGLSSREGGKRQCFIESRLDAVLAKLFNPGQAQSANNPETTKSRPIVNDYLDLEPACWVQPFPAWL
jgi:hypothetical protein